MFIRNFYIYIILIYLYFNYFFCLIKVFVNTSSILYIPTNYAKVKNLKVYGGDRRKYKNNSLNEWWTAFYSRFDHKSHKTTTAI